MRSTLTGSCRILVNSPQRQPPPKSTPNARSGASQALFLLPHPSACVAGGNLGSGGGGGSFRGPADSDPRVTPTRWVATAPHTSPHAGSSSVGSGATAGAVPQARLERLEQAKHGGAEAAAVESVAGGGPFKGSAAAGVGGEPEAVRRARAALVQYNGRGIPRIIHQVIIWVSGAGSAPPHPARTTPLHACAAATTATAARPHHSIKHPGRAPHRYPTPSRPPCLALTRAGVGAVPRRPPASGHGRLHSLVQGPQPAPHAHTLGRRQRRLLC